MDIVLASYPRSGVTYLRHLIEALAPSITTQSLYPEAPMPGILRSNEPWAQGQRTIALVKHHEHAPVMDSFERPGGEYLTAIYLVRDGRDALVSQAHYELAVGTVGENKPTTFEDMLEQLIIGEIPMEGPGNRFYHWGAHTIGWLTRIPKPRILRYSDICEQPLELVLSTVAVILDGLGIPRNPRFTEDKQADVQSFSQLQQGCPWMFRRGISGSWRDEMPERLQRLFWQHHGNAMKLAGYTE